MTHRIRYTSLLLMATAMAANGLYAEPIWKSCTEPGNTTFESWSDWRKITPKPVRSEGHSNNWVGIYVDKIAESTYLNAGSPYPECAKIVKPIYTDDEGKSVRKLTVMVKMAPGYDPENGDWWYASYDATGKIAIQRGKLDDCIPCHKAAAETDYLFSTQVLHMLKD